MTYNCSYENTILTFDVRENGEVVLNRLGFADVPSMPGPVCRVNVSGSLENTYNGAVHSGASSEATLKYKSHVSYDNEDGRKLELVQQDDSMEVTTHFQFYKGVHGVRAWNVVKNISKEPLGLDCVSSLCLTLCILDADDPNEHVSVYIPHNKWSQEANWKKKSLDELGIQVLTCSSKKRYCISNTGHWSSKEYLPMGAVENTRDATCALWQIESNGSWSWEVIALRMNADNGLYLNAQGPDENLNGWYKQLEAGESFESVKCAVAFGKDFNGALENLTKYRRCMIDDRGADANNPVIFNDYMNCLMANPDDKKSRELIDLASELGCEYYMMDAGWYADPSRSWWDTVGEWKENRDRFPDGVKAVGDYAKSKGMKFGLWLEIEVMGINCPILDRFEDECFIMRHGKKVVQRQRYHFDFRNPKVVEYATSIVDRVVTEYGADYIKFDHNIDPGIGTEVDSDSYGDGLLEHCRALVEWKNDIRKKYPNLIMESCSSGGMRTDYLTLSTGFLQSVSDQQEAIINTLLSSACPTALLPEQCGMWAYPQPVHTENDVITAMVNVLMLRPYISGKLHLCAEKSRQLVKEGLSLYKEIRGDVSKAIPFYPLGLTKYSDKFFCTGYKCDDKTYLCVWNIDEKDIEKDIPLENAKQAKILYPSVCNYAEAEVAADGIKVKLEKSTAVFLEIR